MLICPVCGKVNPAGARNCDVCGAPLAGAERAPDPASLPLPSSNGTSEAFSGPICPVCRRPNRSASVFCAHCGARLRPNSGGPAYAMPHVAAAAPAELAPAVNVAPDVTGNIPTGTVLKRHYRILRKVAQGGMGAVYEATDTHGGLGNRWAIKEISPAALPPGERTQAVMDFRREAQMLASLHHPNLVGVVETFEELSKHFLVMEFVPGRTLLNILDANGGPLPEERVLVWARQIADVIQYLHAQVPPVIYRDLKPANVMQLEGTERIKLIDFGIARLYKASKSQDTEAFGTAGYAPPEQYGKGQTDQRSDIYAFAATLHHLLTNRDPSLNPFNWLPIRRYNPNVSDRVDSAIMNALNLDPQKRFQNIEAFARALGVDLPRQSRPVYQPQPAAPVLPSTPATLPVAPVAATPAAPPQEQAASRPKSSTTTRKKGQPRTQEAPAASTATNGTNGSSNGSKQPAASPAATNSNGSQAAAIEPAALPVVAAPIAAAPAVPAASVAPAISNPAALAASLAPTTATAVPTSRPAADILAPTERTAPGTGTTTTNEPTRKSPASPQPAPATPSAPLEIKVPPRPSSGALVVSERLVDLGVLNRRTVHRVQLKSAGGERVEGTVLASQPWIAYNPTQFKGNAVTLEVKVKRGQLSFGQKQLRVPNLFALIWARTRRVLPFIGFWFWLLLLVASSLGRWLLWGLAGAVGAILFAEALLWLWSVHVRLLVPAERLNTGRLWVKSSGGDQQIEVRVMARPSWIRGAIGWTMALVLLSAEMALIAWLILSLVGVPFNVYLPGR